MTYQSEVLADAPALYWRLGEPSGATAEDATANNRDGTYNGPTLAAAGATIDADTAISCDGVDDYVQSASYTFNQATATVEAWVKIASAGANEMTVATCMQNGPANGTADKLLYIGTDGKLYFYAYDGAPKTTSAPVSAIPTAQWVHVAGTADGTTMRTYVNGVEAGTVAAGNTFTGYTGGNVFVAASCGAGPVSTYLAGQVDEVAFYPSALSAGRVLAHYDAADDLPPAAAPTLFVSRAPVRLA